MEFDLENPLTNFENPLTNFENPITNFQNLHSERNVTSLFDIEVDHMTSQSYFLNLKLNELNLSFRTDAISLIFQISYHFDPFLSYLSVNYLDRFLSSRGIPQSKPWIVKLLAVTCVSLAAKMMKTEYSVFQCEEGFIFDTLTIERMEMLVLGALNWRMRSITPFSFIQFIISLLKLEDLSFMQDLRARAIEIIFKTQNDIEMLEFESSIIAASAILMASHQLYPLQFPYLSNAISKCSYVNKEKWLRCFSTMESMDKEDYEAILNDNLSSNTPVNVLDQHYSSSDRQSDTLML